MNENQTPRPDGAGSKQALCAHLSPKTGKRCSGRAWSGTYCPLHDPANKEKIDAGRRRGGRRLQEKLRALDLSSLRFNTVEDCEQALVSILTGLVAGTIPADKGRVLASTLKLKMECFVLRRIEERLNHEDA